MHALVTNDDGIDSVGLRTLAQAARATGLEVTVAAPDTERSGSSASLSAQEVAGQVTVEERELDGLNGVKALSVQASPALIVFIATQGAFGHPPAIVLSGINAGPNTGQAVLHSGTVGAALTAISHGIPAMALSLAAAKPRHWDTAAATATKAIGWFLPRAEVPVVINVNTPDLPADQLRGLRPARLAAFGAVQATIGKPGRGFIPVTFSEPTIEPGPDTDLALLRQGWVTLTPLHGPSEYERFDLGALPDLRHSQGKGSVA